jgi:hypothetical protein
MDLGGGGLRGEKVAMKGKKKKKEYQSFSGGRSIVPMMKKKTL